ncbi:SRPBCC family protein [Novosphingobium bradum]|uniref:SRPBCC family protein n=1 Tax=Novosphingobium bradum TaxID=1737444 RepID=A0ABV7IR42_9SPHN
MTAMDKTPDAKSAVPDSLQNFVVKESYYDPAFVQREYARLWPRTWQMACREEELARVGDYVTYDIGAESVIVVRSDAETINAFHNVCLHRGRRLVEGSGNMANFPCRFHGWRWSIGGKIENVTQKEDWCGTLDHDDLSLPAIQVDTWGGFVFVNFDPQAQPLREYLGGAADALDPFRIDTMRYRWRKWLKMPCNWKVALEAFNEGYHVAITHYPLNRFGQSQFASRAEGIHGTFYADTSNMLAASNGRAKARKMPPGADIAATMAGFHAYLKKAIDSNSSDSIRYAAQVLPTMVTPEMEPGDIITKLMETAAAIDAKRGVPWPPITAEQYQAGGIDWHIFPNMVLLPMATNCLGYRARPWENDPDWCIFEVYQLERMPEHEIPRTENLRNDDIYDYDFWGEILLQDFQQMEATHKGLKSSGFPGSRLNPKQETTLNNFHRVYNEYLGT